MASGVPGGGPVLRSLDWYRELCTEGRSRREAGFFLVEGERAIAQIAAANRGAVDEVLIDEALAAPSFTDGIPLRRVSSRQLKTIASSATPQGLIAIIRLPEGSYGITMPELPGNRIVLLENVQDPGNVGTVIRSAAAFGINGILLSRQCADPFAPKAVQASAGAILSPWIRRGEEYLETVSALQRRGYRLFCADVRGEPSVDFGSRAPCIIAFGNEGAGLSEDLLQMADFRFSIPMVPGAVESLNVGVSAAITMFAAQCTGGWQTPLPASKNT
jgi:TrmH family RNA methyltransferase